MKKTNGILPRGADFCSPKFVKTIPIPLKPVKLPPIFWITKLIPLTCLLTLSDEILGLNKIDILLVYPLSLRILKVGLLKK